MRDSSMFAPLRNRNFTLLWIGQTISNVGDNVYRVGFIWQVVALTGSATATAAASIALFVPNLLLLPFGGVVVDRLPRRAVMLASDLLRAVFLLALMALALAGQLQLWHLLLISVLFGAADAFFQPAYTAIIPELVPPDVIVRANSISSVGRQSALIAGPLIGGLLVQRLGPAAVFGIDALSFIVSAAVLLFLVRQPVAARAAEPQEPGRGVLSEAREGLAYVMSIPWLWISISIAALSNAAVVGAVDVGLPFLVKDTLDQAAGALGLIYTLHGVGALLGGVLMARLGTIARPGIFVYCALCCMGLSIAVLGLLPLLAVAVVMAMVYGASYQMFAIIWTSTLQEYVPQRLLGRVSSVDYLGSYALMPIGAGLTGVAVAQIGAAGAFVVAGAIVAGSAALALTSGSVRRLGREHLERVPSNELS